MEEVKSRENFGKLNEVYERKLREIDVLSVEYSLKRRLQREGFVSSCDDDYTKGTSFKFDMPAFDTTIEIAFMKQIRCRIKYPVNNTEEEHPSLGCFTIIEYEKFIYLHADPEDQLKEFIAECKEILVDVKYINIDYLKIAIEELPE